MSATFVLTPQINGQSVVKCYKSLHVRPSIQPWSPTSQVASTISKPQRVVCAKLSTNLNMKNEIKLPLITVLSPILVAAALGSAVLLTHSLSADALPVPRLPPIDLKNPKRCTPSSSAMGQANAARDSVLDLRLCDLRQQNLAGYDLAGAALEGANLENLDLTDVVLSKAYAVKANFRGVNFQNAILDRVLFDGSDFTNAIFANSVLSDSTFENANLENTDFTDAYIGDFAQKAICRNPTLKGENPTTGAPTRASLGCR